ncbi:MAG TPA: aminopeptidase [Solirubrobacteraceae bacterium]|nr:aminopeptidase [Solirubrobacteraceae bacterium]
MDDATLVRYTDLVVGFGANVQPGQIVAIGCEPGKEYLVRALAAAAYRRGAKFVDVGWFDPHVKRARIEHADPETLDFVPEWYGQRILALGDAHAARVALSGPIAPGLMADLDPALVGRDRLPMVKQGIQVVNDRTTNWTICPCPTRAWADLVFADLEPAERLERLERELLHVLRLDEDDPIAAWRERADALVASAATLTERRFDALHYAGPGTDLTIGLLPTSAWQAARFQTVDGLEHMPNLPTEEVFTTPDPARTEGVVRSTKPLVLSDGTVVRDLVVRFEGGRVVDLQASEGGGTLATILETDEGAKRLGECALVDREGRIGGLGTIFYDTLLDENAASHIALGQGFPFVLGEADRARCNASELHIDFMIGSDELVVTGLTADGGRVPVLAEGRWQI